MTGPSLATTGSPFGRLAPIVAAAIAVAIIAATLVDHLLVALGRTDRSDAYLDSASLIVLGVVLGVGVLGSTATAALSSAQAAHVRLDELDAPPATPRPDGVG